MCLRNLQSTTEYLDCPCFLRFLTSTVTVKTPSLTVQLSVKTKTEYLQ